MKVAKKEAEIFELKELRFNDSFLIERSVPNYRIITPRNSALDIESKYHQNIFSDLAGNVDRSSHTTGRVIITMKVEKILKVKKITVDSLLRKE